MTKTLFVTGATSGFGEAIARRFAEAGWRVVASGRRRERLQALAASLPPDRVLPLVLDVRDRDAVADAVAGLPGAYAEIDVLVNNAGLALGLGPAQRADLDEWEQMVDTNVKGLMSVTRMLLPGMVERGCGHVVNLGSVAASWPYPGGNCYGATKAFVQQFSRNLRSDLLGTGVRVTNIEPGMAETEFSLVRFKGDAEQAGSVYSGTRPLLAEDIAEAVHWVTTQPSHVNINVLEIMPTDQAWGPFAVHREGR
ncbi:SDR family oxidoreductase [Acidihalobacter prosperus]|uniref:Malonic semialdehyde reductase n=1 Tax=Acidihalobacter prosperus TaxID=160660 RepID=A0A1A6C2G9_9GAMM|nr:SDR family oxidoreductase [Acidihalobacter prosperus]OBS08761.1 malonic semialdehyde reductase [Acidihalobacter prosperus]